MTIFGNTQFHPLSNILLEIPWKMLLEYILTILKKLKRNNQPPSSTIAWTEKDNLSVYNKSTAYPASYHSFLNKRGTYPNNDIPKYVSNQHN